MKSGECIKEGDYVIICKTGDEVGKLIKAESSKSVYLGKTRLSLQNVINESYDAIFELDTRTHRLEARNDLTEQQTYDILTAAFNSVVDANDAEIDSRDNRYIQDNNTSQKLSKDDIEDLKREGWSGKKIVDSLIENSSTFNQKNAFSQEKFLKKKHGKYLNFFRIFKPTVRLLTEMYYKQGAQKLSYLRHDSLAQMLAQCDVKSGGKYIVLDTYMGLVTAAVVNQLLGSGLNLPENYDPGCCIQVYPDLGPVSTWRQAVDAINFPPDVLRSCLFSLQLHEVDKLLNERTKQDDTKGCGDSVPFKTHNDKFDEKQKRKFLRKIEEEKARKILRNRNMDGLLIVANNFEPANVLLLLLHLLSPSKSFAVFSPTVELLVNCYKVIKGKTVNIKISETFLRRYQVLPGRTRPDMTMSGCSGYLLTGIKVNDTVC